MIPHHLHFCNTGIARIFVKRTDVFGHASKIAVNMHCYLAYTVYSSPLYTAAPLLSPCFSTFLSTSLPSIFIYGLLRELRHSASVKNRLCKTNSPHISLSIPREAAPLLWKCSTFTIQTAEFVINLDAFFPSFFLQFHTLRGILSRNV